MGKKRLRFLLPALLLVGLGLFLLRGRRQEPVYLRTAAFGRLTENIRDDPFTVYRWDGGETYLPVFTAEEEVWPEASAIAGETLYYAVRTEETDCPLYRIYRLDLHKGEKECLAELESRVWWLKTCGEELFLVVYDGNKRRNRLGVLREGAFLDCASTAVYHAPIACDDWGCWYVDYDGETFFTSLCYLPADTLVPMAVYENVPRPVDLQAAPEGVYLSCQYGEDFDAGTFSLFFYPRDGSGAADLLTDLIPHGPEVSEKKKAGFMGSFALWRERLFYVTYHSSRPGEDQGCYLHCLDRKTGKVTDYGRIEPDTGVGTVEFRYLMSFGKRGFLLNASNWWASEPEQANVFSFCTWSGKRTELRLEG